MKKLMIALAFAGFTMSSFAQDADPTLKYSVATNSFWSNWFIEAGADYNIWYGANEHGDGVDNGNLFSKNRRTFGASVAVGKWFTPGIGLRTKVQAWKAKAMVADAEKGINVDAWIAKEQVMFNLSNLLCGYNPNRVWNVTPFVGFGAARNMSWDNYAMTAGAGVQSSWKLNRHLNIYAELGWDRIEGEFSGAQTSNKRFWKSSDEHIYAEVGLTFKLGKSTWEKTPDVDAIKSAYTSQIDALNSQLSDANAENARLKNLLANQKPAAAAAVKEFVSAPISVFFKINRNELATKRDFVNVEAMANYAKENNANLVVTGYADSATGTAEINQALSEARANAIADKLVELGVSRDNIKTVAKGGVDGLSPISYNRRATVEIK